VSVVADVIPSGWRIDKIGKMFDSWGGHTPSKANASFWGPGLPWVSSQDVKNVRLTGSTHSVTPVAVEKTGLRVCPAGSVLVVTRSGVLAHTLPVTVTDVPVTINQDIKAFYSPEPYLAEWLAIFLRVSTQSLLASSRRDGTTVQSIQSSLLKDIQIAVPPMPERRLIIEAIAKALETQSVIPPHLKAAERAIQRLRQAILIAACSGRLTSDWRKERIPEESAEALLSRIEASRRASLGRRYRTIAIDPKDTGDVPADWTWTTPEQLLQPGRSLTYGVIKLGLPVADGIPTLRSSDVRWLRIDAEHVKRIGKDIADGYKRTYLQGGEILVTVRGSLGGVAVVPPTMKGWNISREVAVLPFVPNVHALYFAIAIASNRSRQWLGRAAKGVAYTGVNIEDLKRLPLPFPSFDEQLEITRRTSKLLADTDALLARVTNVSKTVEHTSQAILAKAFRGELLSSPEPAISA
jgi:type I restriction enzyme, S subunit